MTPSNVLVLLAFAIGVPRAKSPAIESTLSRQLTLAALDQEALLHTDSALALLRAARRADSTDVVAEYQYVMLRRQRFELASLRDEYSRSAAHWSARGKFCWTPAVTEYAEQRFTLSEIAAGEGLTGATPCSTSLTSLQEPHGTATHLAHAARAVREYPELPALWSSYASGLERNGQTARAEATFLEGERAVGHPLLRAQLATERVLLRLRLGDTAGARALQSVVRSAVLRDGRPGVFRVYLESAIQSRVLSVDEGGDSSIFAQLLGLSEASGDAAGAAQALIDRGKALIDRGEPRNAIPLLSRAVTLADALHVSDLQLIARTLRGRAYMKAGQLTEAERDLRVAIAAGERAARAYFQGDAYHNLAHLYESEGRWPEASRAVDRFVTLARRMTQTGPGATSLLDAGEIRWKAGWHASADVAFRELVRVIDSTHDWYYAGQYYERSGDFARARSYYVRGVQHDAFNPLSLAGMSRVHAALGHPDSAEVWARAHDAQKEAWTALEIPMLPPLLARQGRIAEATRIAHEWADRQIGGGNVEGAAIAMLQVAQLLLDAQHPDSALAEAERIDSIASAFNLTRAMIQARTIRGTALLRLHRNEAAVRTLDSALAFARRHPTADNLFEMHVALGEALATTGRTDGALREYDLAARAVEHATLGIADDFDRAGYRERNLRPFDGAVRLLLASDRRARRADELVRWSSRRNAAALALAASGGASIRTHEPRAPSLAELQSRLGADELLLSYTVLDTTVSAIAVVSDGARLVRLSISAANLAAKIETLRRPLVTTYSGRLDLARARYASGVAEELYAALIGPFKHELAGRRRLLVSPDGPLNALAFDALVASPGIAANAVSAGHAVSYLLDSFEVEYLPSPAFLRSREERSRAQRLSARRLLAVGYGAPGSEAEIQALRDIWPRHLLTTIESRAATETAIRSRMANFGVVHFAVHAVADARDPLASHLRIVADSVNDGYFHTNEIASARINADLVVLSACETNAGPISSSEGVMGIARAFLASGAHAVIGTQWPIGAETAVLMREFYTRLARGEAPASALRAAKLMVRRAPRTAHPFHWAGFVLLR